MMVSDNKRMTEVEVIKREIGRRAFKRDIGWDIGGHPDGGIEVAIGRGLGRFPGLLEEGGVEPGPGITQVRKARWGSLDGIRAVPDREKGRNTVGEVERVWALLLGARSLPPLARRFASHVEGFKHLRRVPLLVPMCQAFAGQREQFIGYTCLYNLL